MEPRNKEEIAVILTGKFGKSVSVEDVASWCADYERTIHVLQTDKETKDQVISKAKLTVDRAMEVLQAKEQLLGQKNTEIDRLQDDIEREAACSFWAFVAGAKWWEFTKTGATMWGSDVAQAERAAAAKYPFKGPYIDKLEEAIAITQAQLTAIIGTCLPKDCAACGRGADNPNACDIIKMAKDALARVEEAQKPR